MGYKRKGKKINLKEFLPVFLSYGFLTQLEYSGFLLSKFFNSLISLEYYKNYMFFE